jgi:phosphoribosylanthranilate isomerase
MRIIRNCTAEQAKPVIGQWRFLILSGGLNAQNVSAAIAAVAPDAIDVCSAVETAPGLKNHDAIRKFIAAVRA